MIELQLLNQKLKRVQTLESVIGLLGWDEQVMLPPESADQRQDQNAALAEVIHQAQTDPEIGTLLDGLETQSLNQDQQTIIKVARKEYDRATKVPASWVEKSTRLQSEAYHAWAKARANDDYASYAPFIERHLECCKEFAAYLGWEDRPYDLMIDLHDPGVDAQTINTLFQELKPALANLLQEIEGSAAASETLELKGFPVLEQKAFLESVIKKIGFNSQRGRLDTSLHPFCSGNGADTRMTTRFDKDNPLDSLFSSIHETGHALYEQGLPLDCLHNALGKAAGMGVHESQSRIWENQVARSRAFWKYFEPEYRKAFPDQLADISSEKLYRSINSVKKNLIRVDADEVTYNLHIIIRFEIEQRLFSGELSVTELPEYWNAQYTELLGITPPSDKEGVLQDVHWSGGAFGYFPSYCLGNMLAAQLWYTALEEIPNLESHFEQGDFSPLLDWLRKHIHQQGSRDYLLELTKKVTGKSLSPHPLIRYLEERYLPLYA